jgi:hypothetical protein
MSRGDAYTGSSNDDDAGGVPGLGVQDQEFRAPGRQHVPRATRAPGDGDPDTEARTKTRTVLQDPLRSVRNA